MHEDQTYTSGCPKGSCSNKDGRSTHRLTEQPKFLTLHVQPSTSASSSISEWQQQTTGTSLASTPVDIQQSPLNGFLEPSTLLSSLEFKLYPRYSHPQLLLALLKEKQLYLMLSLPLLATHTALLRLPQGAQINSSHFAAFLDYNPTFPAFFYTNWCIMLLPLPSTSG